MAKSLSQHAVDKINDILSNHPNHVGSVLKKANPKKYESFVASDCITFAIWVLKYAFKQTGNSAAEIRVASLGNKGTDLAKYLINIHSWQAVYYNPDVNHPMDGSGEHISSYYNQVKKTCLYSIGRVPVTQKVINYRPSGIKVTKYLGPTKKNAVDLEIFKKIPFGIGMSKGGTHVWIYSLGKVYESHWDREAGSGLYTGVDLTKFAWLSGIVVVPPDSLHLLKMSKVTCP